MIGSDDPIVALPVAIHLVLGGTADAAIVLGFMFSLAFVVVLELLGGQRGQIEATSVGALLRHGALEDAAFEDPGCLEAAPAELARVEVRVLDALDLSVLVEDEEGRPAVFAGP